MAEARVLAGARILIVEDEYLVAVELKEILSGMGAEVVGPVSRLQPARDLARSQRLDGAVLDVKLNGDTSFPLAEDLLARAVPILFMTGFDSSVIPKRFRNAPWLPKPVSSAALQRLALERFGP